MENEAVKTTDANQPACATCGAPIIQPCERDSWSFIDGFDVLPVGASVRFVLMAVPR